MQVGLGELILCAASTALAGLAAGWRLGHSMGESQLEETERRHRAEMEESERKLTAGAAGAVKLAAELESVSASAENLRSELDRVRREYAILEPQLQKVRQAMKRQEVEMCELLASKMALSQELEGQAAQVASLACGFGELELLKQGMADREERLTAYDDRYQILLGEMHSEVGGLRARLLDIEPMLADAGDREGRLIEFRDQHERILREKEDEIARLRSELRRL